MVKSYRAYIFLAVLVFFLDQISKFFVKAWQLSTSGNVIDITFVTNVGSMFSLFDSVSAINIIFIIVSFLAIGFLVYYIEQEKEYAIGIGLLLGGILGNLVDRLFHGAVIDWVNLHFWPIFNIADMGIVFGVIIVIIGVLVQEKGVKKIR